MPHAVSPVQLPKEPDFDVPSQDEIFEAQTREEFEDVSNRVTAWHNYFADMCDVHKELENKDELNTCAEKRNHMIKLMETPIEEEVRGCKSLEELDKFEARVSYLRDWWIQERVPSEQGRGDRELWTICMDKLKECAQMQQKLEQRRGELMEAKFRESTNAQK
ncbi:hypothetical protein K461DRAFT_298061 [Myriangium duriaei CBS 260.36]|uniref:Uncharacterized protein n=1 Tax=Myriangium duriaei CBS 260.36 TaxID=1168546 RepID=A0A9P4IWC1_9PEZI|nr:hypothetical protein K461DRAFT_298061 [Myriangium duriaei CBS 260.36]